MSTTGELLRELRVEELTASGADRLLDDVLAIEKAMAGLKVLLAGRASSGQGAPLAADRLARRSGTSQRQAADLLAAARKVGDQPKVEAALRDGGLSEEQATLIVDAAAANPAATEALLETAKDRTAPRPQGPLRSSEGGRRSCRRGPVPRLPPAVP